MKRSFCWMFPFPCDFWDSCFLTLGLKHKGWRQDTALYHYHYIQQAGLYAPMHKPLALCVCVCVFESYSQRFFPTVFHYAALSTNTSATWHANSLKPSSWRAYHLSASLTTLTRTCPPSLFTLRTTWRSSLWDPSLLEDWTRSRMVSVHWIPRGFQWKLMA